MAKRRRLSPARTEGPGAPGADDAVEVLDRPRAPRPTALPVRPATRAPIAGVAGEAAASAALDELASEMRAARAEGRFVETLPLGAVEAEHLMRDRVAADEAEMAALMASLRAHGQRTPIEVTPTGPSAEDGREAASGDDPRYGLISGWRRLAALKRLHAETGEARFATVRALVRRPRDAVDAYVSMVEENEVRAQLSHYERARLVARASDAGVFADEDAAVQVLFAAASPARRSKIKAFVPLHRAFGEHLRHPAAIPERLGLALAKTLKADPGLADRLATRLATRAGEGAEAELAILREAAEERPAGFAAKSGGRAGAPRKARRPRTRAAEAEVEIRPGLRLSQRRSEGGCAIVLSGPGVDGALRERLADWLREGA